MQILSVELENVKSFELATVKFAPGVNAIVGHNGAGKSTILEAIGFALFDAVEYTQSLFMRAGSNYARVAVTFLSNADERAYTVQRRIGTRAAYFVHDPELDERVCDGKADVTIFLRQHMGLEPGVALTSLFKDAVGVPQGTLTAAFLLTPRDRKSIFDALLRVDEYGKVWERLREPLSVLADRRKETGFEIRGLEAQLARVPLLRAELADATTKLRDAETRLRQAGVELEKVQTRRGALEGIQAEVLAAERALAQANQALQGSRARLLAAEQALADAQAAREIVIRHQDGYDRYVTAQAEQATLDGRVRQRQQVEVRRSTADRGLALARATQERLAADLVQAQAAAASAIELAPRVEEQTRVEEQLAHAQQEHARWEAVRRRVMEQGALVARLTQRQASLQEQVARGQTIETTLRQLDLEIASAATTIVEQRDAMTGCKTRADLIKEQSATLADVQTAICPVCEQPLTETHRRELLARNEVQLKAMRSEYRSLQTAAESGELANGQRQAEIKTLQAELRKLARGQELETTQVELAAAQAALTAAEREAAELAAVAETLVTLRGRLASLGDVRRRYDVAQAQAGQQDALLAQQVSAKHQVAQAEAALADLAAEMASFADLDGQIEAVSAALAQHNAAYQAVLSSRRQAEEVDRRQQTVAEGAQEVATLTDQVVKLEATQQQAAARFDQAEYTDAVTQEQALRQEIGGLQAGVDHMNRDKARLARDLSDLEALAATLHAAQTRLTRLEWEEAALGQVRELIRQAGPYIAETVSRQVSEGARQIYSDLMQDFSRHLGWTQDYGITLEVDGHVRQFEQLSGGEQMSAALSVRLALLREMSSIDVAFFDEPTANLDEARREALARQILQVRGFQQIIVISHDDTFEQATQNLLRVQRVNGASRIHYG